MFKEKKSLNNLKGRQPNLIRLPIKNQEILINHLIIFSTYDIIACVVKKTASALIAQLDRASAF